MFDVENPFLSGSNALSYMDLLKMFPHAALKVNQYLASLYIYAVRQGRSSAMLDSIGINKKYHNRIYNEFYRDASNADIKLQIPVMEMFDEDDEVHGILKLSLRDNEERYKMHFLRTAYKKGSIERLKILNIIIESHDAGKMIGKYER
jgi:hypothetical protein